LLRRLGRSGQLTLLSRMAQTTLMRSFDYHFRFWVLTSLDGQRLGYDNAYTAELLQSQPTRPAVHADRRRSQDHAEAVELIRTMII